MYFIVLEGESVPTNKFGWPDSGALNLTPKMLVMSQLAYWINHNTETHACVLVLSNNYFHSLFNLFNISQIL